MAFVGYVESVSNLHTAEIRCQWLARLVDEHFKLPSVEKMLQQTTKEMEIMKRTREAAFLLLVSTTVIKSVKRWDRWTSWRKKNWLAEAFRPYNSQDYVEEK
ncbi:hypothetical protein Vadar_016743 [Vaccinium darrowii]|uniref:Uncharacterized protein n=1 Tax=Vaccinium darrowii TaxID=229202 RepID=A0ACB7YE74_9ERIC|nr:hypothetical protein Vadar_016743 [Vaccinium darrowii]